MRESCREGVRGVQCVSEFVEYRLRDALEGTEESVPSLSPDRAQMTDRKTSYRETQVVAPLVPVGESTLNDWQTMVLGTRSGSDAPARPMPVARAQQTSS